MIEKFYYFRDDLKNPVITVCLLKDGEHVARGVAICSAKDPILKRKGRGIARGRALQALTKQQTLLPVSREEAFQVFDATSEYPIFSHKANFDGELTNFEKKLCKV